MYLITYLCYFNLNEPNYAAWYTQILLAFALVELETVVVLLLHQESFYVNHLQILLLFLNFYFSRNTVDNKTRS